MAGVIQFLFGGDLVRRLAGPILDKELRVASRRRRTFALRLAYLLLLGAFAVFVWTEAVAGGRFGAYSIMQMAAATPANANAGLTPQGRAEGSSSPPRRIMTLSAKSEGARRTGVAVRTRLRALRKSLYSHCFPLICSFVLHAATYIYT